MINKTLLLPNSNFPRMESDRLINYYKPIWICLVVAALVGVNCGCEDSSRMAVVSGGSMAPNLFGEHYLIKCDECEFCFAIDAIRIPKSRKAICPNCGYGQNDIHDSQRLAANRASVKKIKKYRRWDVVAFDHGDTPVDNRILVKRLVGMPGETVKIDRGDIFINGQMLSKSDEIAKQIRIPVFDSEFLPAEQLATRFNTSADSAWDMKDGKIIYQTGHTTGWLRFMPVKGYRHSGKRFEPANIEDSYAYNQNVARRLNKVSDLEVVVAVNLSADAEFLMRLGSAEVSLKQGSVVARLHNDKLVQTELGFDINDVRELSVRNFDRQLFVKINGKDMLKESLTATETGDQKISLGGRQGRLEIERIQIFRDLFYTKSSVGRANSVSEMKLGNDEYFVLGDNCPISLDSRRWGAIKQQNMLGVVESSAGKDGGSSASLSN